MSLRFSRVTLTSDGKTASFLTGGIPQSRADLLGWTAYDNYISDVPRYTAVNARVETFLYGGEEPFDATPEEVAYFYKRIERQPDFIDTRTEKTGESDFTVFNL
jgi:hypothetical protein